MNADNLTIDAQSALRRCIELFSSNTRFFIIVENKHKLLNPILSRFCEIYVPEYIENGKVVNLHKLNMKYENHSVFAQDELIHTKMTKFIHETMDHSQMVEMAVEFYENGMSCLDFIRWIENAECIDGFVKTEILMKFDNFNIIWDHAVGIGNGNYGRDHGIAFIGNNGTLVLSRSGWEVIEEKKNAGKVLMPFIKHWIF